MAGSRDDSPVGRARRVPANRVERFFRLGLTTGSMAASAAFDGARRLLEGETPKFSELLFSGRNSEQLAESLGRMRGAAMKLGQLLSLEGGTFLPEGFSEALERLRSAGDTMTERQLHGVLSREYGSSWRGRFRDFDETPVAAASIGQVHRVSAQDGRDLALKVQFPGVAQSIAGDVDNLALLLRTTGIVPTGYDLDPLIEEVKRQLRHETDYLAEAKNLADYGSLCADEPRVKLPGPHPDLCTERILAMDFVEAEPLSVLWEGGFRQELRDEIATLAQRLVLRELFEFRIMQSDPNFDNYMFDLCGETLVLLDFGSTVSVSGELAGRYRELIRASLEDDFDRIGELTVEFGWLGGDESEEQIRGLAEFLWLAMEPLRAPGKYDYGASDLIERIQAHGMALTFEKGLRRPPPPEVVFIHRKLAGTYLLCTKLGARVDSGQMTLEVLGQS